MVDRVTSKPTGYSYLLIYCLLKQKKGSVYLTVILQGEEHISGDKGKQIPLIAREWAKILNKQL